MQDFVHQQYGGLNNQNMGLGGCYTSEGIARTPQNWLVGVEALDVGSSLN